jgi:hypothetical protein
VLVLELEKEDEVDMLDVAVGDVVELLLELRDEDEEDVVEVV